MTFGILEADALTTRAFRLTTLAACTCATLFGEIRVVAVVAMNVGFAACHVERAWPTVLFKLLLSTCVASHAYNAGTSLL